MEMTIDIENVGPDDQLMIIRLDKPLDTTDKIFHWNDRMDLIANDLEDIPCAERISYDKWKWSSSDELNRYLTYYLMRFEGQDTLDNTLDIYDTG